MKPLILVSTCGLAAAALAACTPTSPPVARLTLDCPTSQGDLTRTAIAPDGKTCAYNTRDGDEISLRLVSAPGGYQAALAPIEQELRGEVLTDKQEADAKVKAADADVKVADAKAGAASAASAARAAKQATDDALGEVKDAHDSAKDASDVAANTHIDLPGIHIDADENGKADVDVGMIHVNAGENGATVRMAHEVRLRGEALSTEKRGFRATFILAQDNLKDGWRAVGYAAGGPKVGPITVAVVKSKNGDRHDILDDVKRLVRRNSGA
jgi:hypothetical protein